MYIPVPVLFRTSPPHSHLTRVCRYPHVRECTLPLPVLAVACTMRNQALSYTALRNVSEHYGALRDVMKRYGTDTETIDYARYSLKFKFCSSLQYRHVPSQSENINPKVPIKTM